MANVGTLGGDVPSDGQDTRTRTLGGDVPSDGQDMRTRTHGGDVPRVCWRRRVDAPLLGRGLTGRSRDCPGRPQMGDESMRRQRLGYGPLMRRQRLGYGPLPGSVYAQSLTRRPGPLCLEGPVA